MTWTAQHTQLTTATADGVWRRWITPEFWGPDDPDTAWATFDAPAAPGVRGRVKALGSPVQRFTFTSVEPGHGMNFVISLPLAKLSFPHSMRETPAGLEVTHGVRLDGPLAGLYAIIIGRSLARGLPEVVRLVTAAAL
ncbi:hypothetical protein [Glaciihabitans sp. dw_435]|uniref:hypothetical protein n=1 Tax=Glaciihabitans sp. dw_435 TaxID=2720081 RepID=UPI001BD5BDF8|nr:hypothetical protein [Glaciihabitans sp. dw_435]